MARLHLRQRAQQQRQIAAHLARAAAGQQQHFRRAGRKLGGSRDGGGGQRTIDHRMPDEARRHLPITEPFLLEGQQAQHAVGAATQLVQSPRPPRPQLRRHQMAHARAASLHALGNRKVGRRRIHRHMHRHAMLAAPAIDGRRMATHRADARDGGKSHRAVVGGTLDHGGAGRSQLRPAPGDHRHVRRQSTQGRDHRCRMRIARGLECRDQHAAARRRLFAFAALHGHTTEGSRAAAIRPFATILPPRRTPC